MKTRTAAIQTSAPVVTSATKKLVVLALLSAIAFTASFFKVPVISFLKYEPKDIFLVIAGLVYGPLAALGTSLVSSLIELTASDTGLIGMIMNFLSSAAFACTAALIYKKRRDILGAVIGLTAAVGVMTVTMLLWNYLISPLYMGVTREQIVPMLTTVFLPFNLLKAGINATLALLIYRPFLRAMHMLGYPVSDHLADSKKATVLMASVSAVLLALCVGVVIYLNQK